MNFNKSLYMHSSSVYQYEVYFLSAYCRCRWTILVLTFLQLFGGGAIAIKFYFAAGQGINAPLEKQSLTLSLTVPSETLISALASE